MFQNEKSDCQKLFDRLSQEDAVKGCLFLIACEETELANNIYALTGEKMPGPELLDRLLEKKRMWAS